MASLSDIQSVLYDDCPYTTFPSAVDTITRKTDMDVTTRLLVDRYNTYISSANFTAANELLASNPGLRQTVMVAEDYNRMRDGLIAVQRVFNGYVADYIAAIVKNKGIWSETAEYQKYDVVTYTYHNQVRTYICLPEDETLVSIPVATIPTDTRYWACITLTGKQGASGTGLSPRGAYEPTTVYYKNDLVIYEGKFYVGTTTAEEDPLTVTETSALLYKSDGAGGYTEVPVGTYIDPTGTFYRYNNGTSSYDVVTNISQYSFTTTAPYEIYNEVPSADAPHWTFLELSHVDDRIIPGITIAAESWVDGQYSMSSDIIDSNTLVDVFFNKDSLLAASKAGIYVDSINGALNFYCMEAPEDSIVIDYFRIRKDIIV